MQSQVLQDRFCVLPFIHMQIGNTGLFRICCQTPWITNDDGKLFNIYEDSVADVWNSKYMRQVRQELIAGKPITQCEQCWQREQNGGQSRRITENLQWQRYIGIESVPPPRGLFKKLNHYIKWKFKADEFEKIKAEAIRNNYVVKLPAVDFEFEVGNVCNLKCRMCSPLFSSLIQDDPVHSRWRNEEKTIRSEHQRLLKSDDNSAKLRSEDGHWLKRHSLVFEELLHTPKSIRNLCFKGGEPMISKEVCSIVSYLTENGDTEHLRFSMITNGTIYQPDLLRELSKAKFCVLSVSIDGTGPCYEYIRYPAKWRSLKKNMQHFTRYENIFLTTSITLQMYNLMDIVDLFKFCDQNHYQINCHILRYPSYLSQFVMPPKARKVAAQRILEYMENGCQEKNKATMRSFANSLISLGDDLDIEDLKTFVQFTWELDNSRNQDFRAVNAELWGYIEELGISWPSNKTPVTN